MSAVQVIDAAGHDAELHIRGCVELDHIGYHITDTEGRRWNLQWDDLVTPAPASGNGCDCLAEPAVPCAQHREEALR